MPILCSAQSFFDIPKHFDQIRFSYVVSDGLPAAEWKWKSRTTLEGVQKTRDSEAGVVEEEIGLRETDATATNEAEGVATTAETTDTERTEDEMTPLGLFFSLIWIVRMRSKCDWIGGVSSKMTFSGLCLNKAVLNCLVLSYWAAQNVKMISCPGPSFRYIVLCWLVMPLLAKIWHNLAQFVLKAFDGI